MAKNDRSSEDLHTLKQLFEEVEQATKNNTEEKKDHLDHDKNSDDTKLKEEDKHLHLKNDEHRELNQESHQSSSTSKIVERTANEKEQIEEDSIKTDIPNIQVLDLPPRKEVHQRSKMRLTIKLSKPLLRFIGVCLLLIALFIGAYYLWGNDFIEHIFQF